MTETQLESILEPGTDLHKKYFTFIRIDKSIPKYKDFINNHLEDIQSDIGLDDYIKMCAADLLYNETDDYLILDETEIEDKLHNYAIELTNNRIYQSIPDDLVQYIDQESMIEDYLDNITICNLYPDKSIVEYSYENILYYIIPN